MPKKKYFSMLKESLQFKHHPLYLLNIETHRDNMKKNLHTLEALLLLDMLLYYSPTNYTLWADRRKLLLNMSREEHPPKKELNWIREMAKENQKNYQIWNHFLYVVSELQYDILKDEEILDLAREEPKNIHFWGFFLLSVNKFSSIHEALEVTKSFIQKDIRNNSAYSIRYSLLKKHIESLKEEEGFSLIEGEKDFLIGISKLKNNSSFWNYVSALDKAHSFHRIHESCADALRERVFQQQSED